MNPKPSCRLGLPLADSSRRALFFCLTMTAVFPAVCPPDLEAAEAVHRITARDLMTLRDIEGLSVSPDGQWAAFQIRTADPDANEYDTAWVVLSTRGGAPHRLAEAGHPLQPAYMGRVNGFILPVPPVWSPDNRWIAYLRKDNGRTQVWRSSRDGQRTEQLSRNDGDVRAIAYSKDGRRLLFETESSRAEVDAALADEGLDGYLYDNRFFPVYSPLPVMPKDVAFGRADGASSTESAESARLLRVYDFARKRGRAATKDEQDEFTTLTAQPKPEGRENFRENAASSPAGGLAWTEARDPARQGAAPPLTIAAQPLGATEAVICLAPECTSNSIKGLWWRSETEVIFARGEGPTHQDTALYSWTIGQAQPRLVLRTSGKLTSYAEYEWSCTIARDRLLCFFEEAARPRRLVAVDIDTAALQTLYDPNPRFILLDLGPQPQRVEIRTSTGVETYGYLVLPPAYQHGARLPLIVVTYRCSGFLRGGSGDEYPIYAFAARGYAVFCFNTPVEDGERLTRVGWTEYGQWLRGEDDPVKHRVQEALDAAVVHLADIGVVDTNRIGLTGLSFGAETVTFALFSMRIPITAAITSGVGFEPMDYYLYGPAFRDVMHSWGWRAPDVALQRWRTFALSLNADTVRAPLLLNVADHEMLSALQSVTALQQSGRSVEMYVYPHEFHVKWQPAHRLAIYNRNIDWMNFWLQGVEDKDPEKAAQYERWRAMRVKQCELFTGGDAPWYCRQ